LAEDDKLNQSADPQARPQDAAGETSAEGDRDPAEALAAERDELKDRLLRVMAETENYKKRTEREKSEQLKRANEGLLKDLLPVLDNLERALEHAIEDAGPGEAMAKGLELTYQELWKVLERHGVERVEALGQPFDPEVHEAMMQQEDPDHEPGTVIGEMQRGYLLAGRLLRPAMVVVSKPPAGEESEGSEEGGEPVKVTVH
jgi:molecular chaperone GrpE